MDHLVLIPQDFNLVVTSENMPQVTVWSSQCIAQSTIYHPFQGTVRTGKLNVFSTAKDDDVRHRFGLYDEITYALDGRKVRNCNWVRFLKVSASYGPQVNIVCTKIGGEVIYEAVKPISMHQELIVFYLPERPEELLMGRMKHSFYRRTMDSILEDSPLDLSLSLVADFSPISSPIHTEDERKSISGDSYTSSGNSSSGDLNDTTIVAQPKQRTPRGERNLLPCEVCGKAFDRPSLLKRHMRTHTGEKPHICNVCGKGFSTSSSLNTHRRIHTGEKPHECPVCGKRFTASSNLYYHRMTHQKSKPHKCSLCPKSFPTPGDLRSHMYVHSGSWPFKCQICSRGFSKQTNLKNHLFLHTGDKPHSCHICLKKFALACNLRAHLKTHEDEQQECCVRCGKDFLTASVEITDGICQRCDEEPIPVDEDEIEKVVAIRHKKFSNKLLG